MAWPGKDRGWFEREVLPHLSALYQFAVELAGLDDAEDLVQTAVLRAWQRRALARPDRSLRPWLFAILRHEWIDECRRRQRVGRCDNVTEELLLTPLSSDPMALVAQQRNARRVRDALRALPEAFRWPVYLKDVEGFGYREIGEILGLPIGTVMSRLARGRALLRERLEEVAADSGVAGSRSVARKRTNGL